MQNTDFAHLLPSHYSTKVTQYLQEDIPSFDYGGFVVGESNSTAHLYAKSSGVLAGVPFFNEVFKQCNCTVLWSFPEGHDFENVTKKIHIATVTGTARAILQGERVALNILARCSGVASRASKLANLKLKKNWKGVCAATRKTTPGFRMVEKYGALLGGCDGHRMDLSSMIMLKDNHIVAHGSIPLAIKSARTAGGFALKIEVECGDEAEAEAAIEGGADVVMLDNFGPKEIGEVAGRLRAKYGNGKFLIEGSGGLTEENCENYMSEYVDILSFGSITQGYGVVDFSLKIVKV